MFGNSPPPTPVASPHRETLMKIFIWRRESFAARHGSAKHEAGTAPVSAGACVWPQWRRCSRSRRRPYARASDTPSSPCGSDAEPAPSLRWCGGAARMQQGGRGNNGCRLGESVLVAGRSQNLSRGSDAPCFSTVFVQYFRRKALRFSRAASSDGVPANYSRSPSSRRTPDDSRDDRSDLPGCFLGADRTTRGPT